MQEFQRTIKTPIEITGVGVHSGSVCNLRFLPAEIDHGIVFGRLNENGEVVTFKAESAYTLATNLSTVIGQDDVRLETIEHLMSAIVGVGLDNVLIEATGHEVPILDGSAYEYVNLFDDVTLVEQNARRKYMRILKPVLVESTHGFATLEPFAGTRYDVTIAFSTPVIGTQSYVFDLDREKFKYEIAKARTFGFLKDVELLWAKGLALGSSTNNSLVIGAQGQILNKGGAFWKDEFVRHKLLDSVGDLALLGYPFIGKFRSLCGGHKLNAQLVKALLSQPKSFEIVELKAQDN